MSSRTTIAAAGLIAAAIALPASPAAATVHGSDARAARDGAVELVECSRGKRAGDRWALFRGEMRRIGGAAAMRMRFALDERVGRGPWRPVRAPGLDVWRNARPGVAAFAYRQRVAALAPATAYRVWVTFQWLDRAGATLARQTARSAVCRQAGRLPDLAVRGVRVGPGPTPDSARYKVVVVNRGRVPAYGVGVALSVDWADVDTVPIAKLPARARRAVTFYGPRCAERITVQLDPDGRVRELDTRDNLRAYGCDGSPRPF